MHRAAGSRSQYKSDRREIGSVSPVGEADAGNKSRLEGSDVTDGTLCLSCTPAEFADRRSVVVYSEVQPGLRIGIPLEICWYVDLRPLGPAPHC